MTGSPPPAVDISAIVVAYRSEGRIGETVRHLEAALSGLRAEVIVIDNASGDNGPDEARAAIDRGRVVENDENVGFGGGVNQGLVLASGRVSLVMNDDARLGSDDVRRLLEVLDSDRRIGLVGPRILDESGKPMPSAREVFPGPAEELQRFRFWFRSDERKTAYVAGSEPTDVAWLVGACIMGPTETLRGVGGFNPQFFLYGEDIDLARRLHALGLRVVTVPDATCVHIGSVSTTATFADLARVERRARARDLFYRIWLRRPVRMLVHLIRAIGLRHQPWRLRFHSPRVVWDGPSLRDHRFPPPL